MQTRERVMKKIILISLFGLMFSDMYISYDVSASWEESGYGLTLDDEFETGAFRIGLSGGRNSMVNLWADISPATYGPFEFQFWGYDFRLPIPLSNDIFELKSNNYPYLWISLGRVYEKDYDEGFTYGLGFCFSINDKNDIGISYTIDTYKYTDDWITVRGEVSRLSLSLYFK